VILGIVWPARDAMNEGNTVKTATLPGLELRETLRRLRLG
jgi:hypothetical protein